MSSLVFDYTTRQKIGGSHASISFVKQFPVLTPEQVSTSGYEQDIVERIARLCWFNHDLDGWMEELREECPAEYDLPEEPVIWDEGQRAVWQAELDAIFAHLYGLTTEDLRYIPKMCVARAVSTKHSACSKNGNTENLASTVPNAWLWRHGINLDLTDRITIKLSNK